MRQNSIPYAVFVTEIKRRTGIDLNLYKQEQMLRRIHGSMERCGAGTYGEYLALIDRDLDVKQLFLDRLTINVSELFRNPEHFKKLGTEILPGQLQNAGKFKVWSAGCSIGAEPVSLCILIKEVASDLGVAPNVNLEILATDVDASILKHASLGEFCESDMKNVSLERRDRWFTHSDEKWIARSEVMSAIRFKKHNLLADAAPGQFDLVACRNVVIYFSDEAKSRVNRTLFSALKRGGTLFVGGTERINDYVSIGYTNPLPFFYSRPA